MRSSKAQSKASGIWSFLTGVAITLMFLTAWEYGLLAIGWEFSLAVAVAFVVNFPILFLYFLETRSVRESLRKGVEFWNQAILALYTRLY